MLASSAGAGVVGWPSSLGGTERGSHRVLVRDSRATVPAHALAGGAPGSAFGAAVGGARCGPHRVCVRGARGVVVVVAVYVGVVLVASSGSPSLATCPSLSSCPGPILAPTMALDVCCNCSTVGAVGAIATTGGQGWVSSGADAVPRVHAGCVVGALAASADGHSVVEAVTFKNVPAPPS